MLTYHLVSNEVARKHRLLGSKIIDSSSYQTVHL